MSSLPQISEALTPSSASLRKRDELRDNQQGAVRFLAEHKKSILLADMGTGKTAVTLTHIVDYPKPTLIVAPLRVAEIVWHQEAAEWEHTQHLTFSHILGDKNKRTKAMTADADVHVVNIENIVWLMEQYGLEHWGRIVLDELSLWAGGGVRFKKIRNKIKNHECVALTGTPIANGLLKIWPMVKMVDHTLLPRSKETFKRTYFYPVDYQQYDWRPLPFAEKQIFDEIAPIIYRMENDLSQMAELVYNPIKVSLPAKAIKLMDDLKTDFMTHLDGEILTAASAGVLTGKLQQVCNGAIYTEDREILPIHRAKIDACKELVDSLVGEPVIICYNYKHDLAALKTIFPHAPVVGEEHTDTLMAMWNAKTVPVMLGHPAAFGHGLNIQQGGHHMIWFGLNWSLDYFEQAVARLWRSGQRSHTVFNHLLIADGTIDEVIYQALKDKADVQRAMLDYYA
jgi:SNF2 family DNA or RNA helicase